MQFSQKLQKLDVVTFEQLYWDCFYFTVTYYNRNIYCFVSFLYILVVVIIIIITTPPQENNKMAITFFCIILP